MSGCFPLISISLFVSISVCISFFSSDGCSPSRPSLGPDGRGLNLSSSRMSKFGGWFLPARAPLKFTRRQQAFNEVRQAVRQALPLVPAFSLPLPLSNGSLNEEMLVTRALCYHSINAKTQTGHCAAVTLVIYFTLLCSMCVHVTSLISPPCITNVASLSYLHLHDLDK